MNTILLILILWALGVHIISSSEKGTNNDSNAIHSE